MPNLEDRLQRRLRASKVDEDESDFDDYSDLDDSRGQHSASAQYLDESLEDESNDSGEESNEGATKRRTRPDRQDPEGSDSEEIDVDDDDDDIDGNEEEDGSDEDTGANAADTLANISFGALAQAQAAMAPTLKRKRGVNSASDSKPSKEGEPDPNNTASRTQRKTSRSPSPFHEASERREGKKLRVPASRTSKHAPTEISSKRAVSRRRMVVNIPNKPQARDPRFAALPSSSSSAANSHNPSLPSLTSASAANSAYAFLAGYQASELADLRTQAKRERDSARREALTRQVRAIEDRNRAKQRVEEERSVLREHRRNEREKVGKGKTPYFLKKGEVRRKAMEKRYEGFGEKKMERVLEKRRKKKAAKERKGMPSARRSAIGPE